MSEEQIMSLMIKEYERKSEISAFALLRYVGKDIFFIPFRDEKSLEEAIYHLVVGDVYLTIDKEGPRRFKFSYSGANTICSGYVDKGHIKISYLDKDRWGKKTPMPRIDWEQLAKEKSEIVGELSRKAA